MVWKLLSRSPRLEPKIVENSGSSISGRFCYIDISQIHIKDAFWDGAKISVHEIQLRQRVRTNKDIGLFLETIRGRLCPRKYP